MRVCTEPETSAGVFWSCGALGKNVSTKVYPGRESPVGLGSTFCGKRIKMRR